MSLTDDDIHLWHHTRVAKGELKDLARGYDSEDKELSSGDLQHKYQGNILEEKAKTFRELSIEDQKDIVYTGITGEETGVAKNVREAIFVQAVIMSVHHYTRQLKRMSRYEESEKGGNWLDNSCDYKTFIKLPLDEKKKFQGAMVNFHDQCIREKRQLAVPDQVLDSSPTDHSAGCPPNFNDTSKWTEVKK